MNLMNFIGRWGCHITNGERGRGCVLWHVHMHPFSTVIREIGRVDQNRGWTASQ